MMKIVSLAATAATLAACSAEPAGWRTEIVPAVLRTADPSTLAKSAICPKLDPLLAEESKRMTPIAGVGRDFDALTATLMGSEARKNARLRQAIGAYERCRRAGHKS
jgi:hypothetical protein